MTQSTNVERRGLLQEPAEEFDIDSLDYSEAPDGPGGRSISEDWSRVRPSRRPRWLRPRYVCVGLVSIVALLVLGVGLNRGVGIRSQGHTKTAIGSPDPAPPPSSSEPEKTVPSTTTAGGEVTEVPKEDSAPEGVEETGTPVVVGELEVSTVSGLPEESERPKMFEESEKSESFNQPEVTKAPEPSTNTTNATTIGEHSSLNNSGILGNSSSAWEKPKGFKIIGLIFFGRPANVAILDCYLKKNLASNGGWLDEVQFVVNTDKKADIKYLDKLVKTSDGYKKVLLKGSETGQAGYNAVWGTVKAEHMYIKIDDDIVFFDDQAIPNLVYSKIKHPEALNVVANLVNSPETGWLHYRFGAVHAYLPELKAPKKSDVDFESLGPKAWRASALPEWAGEEMSFPVAGIGNGKPDGGQALPSDVPGAPPFKGHRWLPLPDGDKNLWKTPMAASRYEQNGPDWGSWSLGAQVHYSLLENLERDQLSLYHYGSGLDSKHEGIWNMAYERMNINFMAIWGKDVLDNLPFESFDDELALSVQVPIKLRRPLLINTHVVAAHFSFRSQIEMYDTDLLDRYRAYANEKVCTKDNQIKPP